MSAYEPSQELLENERHFITLRVDRTNGDVSLEAASPLALRELALSLLAQVDSGSTWEEYCPLSADGKIWLVVNGARLAEGSSRMFVSVGDCDSN